MIREEELANVVAEANPRLALFAQGGITESSSLMHELARQGVAVIAPTGPVGPHEEMNFLQHFYRRLLSTGRVGQSFERTTTLLRTGGHAHPYRLVGDSEFDLQSGGLTVHRSFSQLRQRLGVQAVLGRSGQMAALHRFFSDGPAGVARVLGAPLSGVTTLLHAAATHYAYLFDENPVHIDLASTLSVESIEESLRNRLRTSGTGLLDILSSRSILVCFDNADRCDEALLVDVAQRLSQLPTDAPSRVVVGTGPRALPLLRPVLTLSVDELSIEDAMQLLAAAVGAPRASHLGQLLRSTSRLPGQLVAIASSVTNGASPAQLREMLEGEVSSPVYASILEEVKRDDKVARLLFILSILGQKSPRVVADRAFSASVGSSGIVHSQKDFDGAVTALREARLLALEEVEPTSEGPTEIYFNVAQEALSGTLTGGADGQVAPAVRAVTDVALDWARSGRLNVHHDAGWVCRAARLSEELDMPDAAADLGRLLLSRVGHFRLSGAAEAIEQLAVAAFSGATRLADEELAVQLGLVLGETYYKSGRLEEARSVFERSRQFGGGSDGKLRALRALGQISYRRRRYAEALELYEQAEVYAESADLDFVATLDLEVAKTLYRLGRLPEAADRLQRVILHRQATGDTRALAKARHEFGRLFHAVGDWSEAERLYLLAAAGAEADQFFRFLPAPLYQLTLLELARGRVQQARDYYESCLQAARRIEDPFWLTLADLALGMLQFAEGHLVAGSAAVARAMRAAQDRGLEQVAEDARTWLLQQPLPGEERRSLLADRTPSPLARLHTLSASKGEKAVRYAHEWHRLEKISVTFDSVSDTRTLTFDQGRWNCTCALYGEAGVCTHLAALALMLPQLFQDDNGRAAKNP